MEIKFNTVSPVILSGRSSYALYEGIDYEEARKEGSEKISIIYPFCSYENRNNKPDKGFEKANSYCIPASSLKGSILLNENGKKNDSKEENSFRQNVIFKDISIKKEHIILKSVCKFQYLYQELKESNEAHKKVDKTPEYGEFFPNVKIEMLDAGVSFKGNVLIKDTKKDLKRTFEKRLDKTCSITDDKLKRYINEINFRIQKVKDLGISEENKESVIEELKGIKKAICDIRKKEKRYIFLGGYKGILGSLTKVQTGSIMTGFYIDKETKLPYGIVEVIK